MRLNALVSGPDLFRVERLDPFLKEIDLTISDHNRISAEPGHDGVDNAVLIRLQFLGPNTIRLAQLVVDAFEGLESARIQGLTLRLPTLRPRCL